MNASDQSAAVMPTRAVIGGEDESAIGSISALSVVSLILGLAAPLSLAAPLLWAIPLAGAAIAMMTIGRIASSDGALVGRLAAVIGLALSVGSLAAAASRSVIAEQVLSHQAREIAIQWLTTLQSGDAQTAFGFTVEGSRGPAPAPPPDSPVAAEPPRDPLASFRENPLVRFLASEGKDAVLRFDHQVGSSAEAMGETRVTEYFSVAPAKGSSSPAITVHVALSRTRPTSLSGSKWLVADYGGDNLTPEAVHDE